MAGAIGGLLGLGTGALLGYAGEQHRNRLKSEQDAQEFAKKTFMDGIHQNPEGLYNPDIQKQGKKLFGPEWDSMNVSMMPHAAEAKRQRDIDEQVNQGIGRLLGINVPLSGPTSRALPAPTGAAATVPSPSSASASSRFVPDAAGNLRPAPSTVPPTAATPPSLSGPATGSTLTSVSGPPPSPVPSSLNMGDFAKHAAELYTVVGDKDKAASWAKIAELEQKNQPTQYQQMELDIQHQRLLMEQQGQKDTEQYRMLSLQLNNAIRQQAQSSTDMFRQFMENMQQSKEEDTQFQQFQGGVKSLIDSHNNILKLKNSSTPPDAKELKGLVDHYNANLRLLTSRAKRLKYDLTDLPSALDTKTVPTYMGLSSKTDVTETEPTSESVSGDLESVRKRLGLSDAP